MLISNINMKLMKQKFIHCLGTLIKFKTYYLLINWVAETQLTPVCKVGLIKWQFVML